VDVAAALIGERPIRTMVTGIRPGEKIHEIMVSDEEAFRTAERGRWYAILPMLPEVCGDRNGTGCLKKEYSSNDDILDLEGTRELLKKRRLMPEDLTGQEGELLR
jgi:UDP-glucose 4-epimerase